MAELRAERLVVLDENVLKTLLADPVFVGKFPVFRTAAEFLRRGGKTGCGKCGASRGNNPIDYNGLLAAIDSFSTEDKAYICQRLNTTRVRLWYKTRTGKVVKSTF